jgi:hypothetical protein
MTAAERREANRLRSERWRWARGLGPRKPAQKPWLAMGISRSTWYRRRKQAALERASAFVAQLQAKLAEAARCQAVMAAIFSEIGAREYPAQDFPAA